MRTQMIEDEELYTGYYYGRGVDADGKPVAIDTSVDIPEPFLYSEVEGKLVADTFPVPGRRNTGESLIIETEDPAGFKPDEIIVIDGAEYNITSVKPKKEPAYDLKAIRFGNNKSQIMVLDK